MNMRGVSEQTLIEDTLLTPAIPRVYLHVIQVAGFLQVPVRVPMIA